MKKVENLRQLQLISIYIYIYIKIYGNFAIRIIYRYIFMEVP